MSEYWTWAGASCIGTSHLKTGEPKQDAFKCFTLPEKKIFFGIICDGAGSAKWGGIGAWITSRIIARRCLNFLLTKNVLPEQENFWDWIDEVRDILHRLASLRNTTISEFATTVVLVLAKDKCILAGNIGDGASVAFDPFVGKWINLSWPEHGEYVSTTHFITEDPQPKFRFSQINEAVSRIVLFSDGIERLALDFVNQIPFEKFLTPMASALDKVFEEGEAKKLSAELQVYLSSERINTRTDDDKTLVIAAFKND